MTWNPPGDGAHPPVGWLVAVNKVWVERADAAEAHARTCLQAARRLDACRRVWRSAAVLAWTMNIGYWGREQWGWPPWSVFAIVLAGWAVDRAADAAYTRYRRGRRAAG